MQQADIPERWWVRAREMGSSIQPRVSLARGEGNPDGNLTKPALASSSWSWWFEVCWARAKVGGEKRELVCWSLRESHVRKRKTERRKGKAWGFLRKWMMRDEVEFGCVGVDVWFANIELWLLFVFANEFLLGFAIITSFTSPLCPLLSSSHSHLLQYRCHSLSVSVYLGFFFFTPPLQLIFILRQLFVHFFFFGREVFYKNIKPSQEIQFGFGLFCYHIESSLWSEGFFFFLIIW